MEPPDDRTAAPPIHADPPAPTTRRTILILTAVLLAVAIGVALHITGAVGAG